MREGSGLPVFEFSTIDIPAIMSPVEIGRIDRSAMPQLLDEARQDADQANMFMRLSIVFSSLGALELAREMHDRALQWRRIFRYSCRRSPTVRLLAVMGEGGGLENAPVEYLLENSDIQLDLVFLHAEGRLPDLIPDHDIAIIGLGEASHKAAQFENLISIFSAWPRPVINRPQFILNCSRDRVYRFFKDVPGLVVADTRLMTRENISIDCFPKIIRPVDSHGGDGLVKIDDENMLGAYLETYADDVFYVIDYVDYRSPDGLFRKMRIALIDGKPHICHLAISDDWIVHYIPAGMELSADKRAEEEALMRSFDHDFAIRHEATLRCIHETLGLDYVVLDCSLLPDGRLLLFEADSRAWIHAVDPVEIFPYKPPVMQKAFDAFRTMLLQRLGR